MKDFKPYTLLDYKDISDELNPLCKKLVNTLATTSFFTNAASYKYHHVYIGGLADHSIEIYNRLKELVRNEGLQYSDSTLFLISVGHDLDKLGQYRYNELEDTFEFIPKSRSGRTHGENSFYILRNYLGESFESYQDYDVIRISIIGHMGNYDRMNKAKEFWYANKDTCRLLVLTHESDAYSCEIAKDNN